VGRSAVIHRRVNERAPASVRRAAGDESARGQRNSECREYDREDE